MRYLHAFWLVTASACGAPGDSGDPGTDCLPATWYADEDGDGFGDLASATEACQSPAGFVDDGSDCDDADPDAWRESAEWLQDGDGDGLGSGEPFDGCGPTSAGWTTDEGDCDDTDPTIPRAEEVFDGIDTDCDGLNEDIEVDESADGLLIATDATGMFLGDFRGVGGAELLIDGADQAWVVDPTERGVQEASAIALAEILLGPGTEVVDAGDVDGDGQIDLLVGNEADWIRAHLGPFDGVDDRSAALHEWSVPDGQLGSGQVVGDLAGTGTPWLALVVENGAGEGVHLLTLGGGGLQVLGGPATVVPGAEGGLLYELDTGGDTQGDGRPELLLGNRSAEGGDGVALLLTDVPAGPVDAPTAATAWVHDPGASGLGSSVSFAPDLTGDGRDDVLLTGNGESFVFPGPLGPALGLGDAAARFDAPGAVQPMHPVGDLDGDGAVDLGLRSGSRCYVLWGPFQGTVGLDEDRSRFGTFARCELLGLPDTDGDGAGTLAVGLPSGNIVGSPDGVYLYDVVLP